MTAQTFPACFAAGFSARRGRRPAVATMPGFTLLELLVVIVIIGMLVAYVGPKYFSQLAKSEVTVARAQIEGFVKALDAYRLDVGRYPSGEQGLGALTARPAEGGERWNGPYLSKAAPKDPWGHAYLYRAPGAQGAPFDLLSLGADGQPGGSGDASDLTN